MEYVVNPAQFELYWQVELREISGTCVQVFFYALYLGLFGRATYTLRNRATEGRTFILRICTLVSANHLLQSLVTLPVSLPERMKIYQALSVAQDVTLLANEFVYNSFGYRCYVIWGYRKKVLILPGALMLSTLITGTMASSWANRPHITFAGLLPYILALLTNVVLVILTAGRIWWKRREAIHVGAEGLLRKRYDAVIAMIVESGAVYCVCVVLLSITGGIGGGQFRREAGYLASTHGGLTATTQRRSKMMWYTVEQSAAAHLANIIPTLIIVRSGVGNNVADTAPKHIVVS
ncbi:hypothetical protein R3P38DRAFT_2936846 [Favolaschia claudopus]|uniref:G protein-coupled receptor n=1 Tax=Favolaschia claudopus TaxID=2862362 RepID=A0AAW0BPZ8_9AGAR